jgi:hypothetical protein
LRETQVIEYAAGDTWRNIQHGLDRMQLVTLATAEGQVAQRSATTADQKASLLKLPEPLRFSDFTIETGYHGLTWVNRSCSNTPRTSLPSVWPGK